jgi:mitochondrial fission protein ELM1
MSDGRAGIEAQARGLAEAVARRRDCEIVVKRIGWKGDLGRLPWWLTLFPRRWLTPESDVSEPWPDILIAAGRATLPLAIRMKKWSGGKTFVVLDWCLRIASQTPEWAGQKVRPGNVVYLAGEGHHGLRGRVGVMDV